MFTKIQGFQEDNAHKTFLKNFGESCLKRIEAIEAKYDSTDSTASGAAQSMLGRIRGITEAYQILSYEMYDSCEAAGFPALGRSILKMHLQMNSMIKWVFKNGLSVEPLKETSQCEIALCVGETEGNQNFRSREINKYKLQNAMKSINIDYQQLIADQEADQDPSEEYASWIDNLQKLKDQAMATNASDAFHILEETVHSLQKKSQYIDKFVILRENYDDSIRYENAMIGFEKQEAELLNNNQEAVAKIKKVLDKFMATYEGAKRRNKMDWGVQTERQLLHNQKGDKKDQGKQEAERLKLENAKMKKQLEICHKKLRQVTKMAAQNEFNRQGLRVSQAPYRMMAATKKIEDYRQDESLKENQEIHSGIIRQGDDVVVALTQKKTERLTATRSRYGLRTKNLPSPSCLKCSKLFPEGKHSIFRVLQQSFAPAKEREEDKLKEKVIRQKMRQTIYKEIREEVNLQMKSVEVSPKRPILVLNLRVWEERIVPNCQIKVGRTERSSRSIKIMNFQEPMKHIKTNSNFKKAKIKMSDQRNYEQTFEATFGTPKFRRDHKHKTMASDFFQQSKKQENNFQIRLREEKGEKNRSCDFKKLKQDRENQPSRAEVIQGVLSSSIEFDLTSSLINTFFISEENAKNYELLTITAKKMSIRKAWPKESRRKRDKQSLACVASNLKEACPDQQCPAPLLNKIYLQIIFQKKNKKLLEKIEAFLRYPYSSVYRNFDKIWGENQIEESSMTYSQIAGYIKRIWRLHLKCDPKRDVVFEGAQTKICSHQDAVLKLFKLN